tara:strand:- start:63 stop:416 length:354 start_codon:yes stop_codon:yes gene_type:complete
MSIYQYKAGLQNAASYQSSGSPYVTGSASLTGVMAIEFPNVTKEITIRAASGTGHLYFHTDALDENKMTFGTTALTLDVKCQRLYVSGSSLDFRVFASLTGIEKAEMFNLTGSGITE